MALVQNTAKESSSLCAQGLTPPNSPIKGPTTSQTIVRDLQYQFGVFLEKALLDITIYAPPNTPVSQDQVPAGPDMVQLKQLLAKLTFDEYPPIELSSDELAVEERLQVADGIDLNNQPTESSDSLDEYADGPPGVGKTFTVEATSERFNLPLYSISAGELAADGGNPNALEQQLEHIFKVAKHFNAVLLLDEADAFMEQRTSYHGTHNRLVTVLLRKLEYYQGILFLTTNRKIQFDEAIMNCIHLTIKYDDLTREFRREVWKSHLSRATTVQGHTSVGSDELQVLIKNLIAIAHALATVDGERVGYKHLELAAGSSESLQEKFVQENRI
ncbi:uncharacterized protein KD926_004828 [Aspergillus affinis]|uniref:uncharacterized protein n=1 Tax=Aspergillus affinis TaxID=1070780 RepID=UPI0022FE8DDE|nr:uncharacterized protein KD926_004828 [Aspergillus affinis]KAI9035001.1 hypothetical protein KD926_004828 [Aspergillus affinis]